MHVFGMVTVLRLMDSGCTDNEATLTIMTDNYPGETTWTIKDANGNTLYSGGPYTSTNSIFTVDICEPDGCYDFTINDTYGDGICCAYGQGYYNVSDASGELIAGGAFTNTETKNFCLGNGCDNCPGAPNEDQNDTDGNGVGDECEPTDPDTDCITINFIDSPVVSYGGNQDQGSATVLDAGQTLRLENNAWKAILLDYEVTENTVISFDFGSTDNYNNVGYWTSYSIPIGEFYTGDFNRLFFVMDHDQQPKNGTSFFTNLQIFEGASCALLENRDGAIATDDITAITEVNVYPNPTSDRINLSFQSGHQ